MTPIIIIILHLESLYKFLHDSITMVKHQDRAKYEIQLSIIFIDF